MLCFPVGFQEYLVCSSKYKSFSRQYSLTWTKTLRFKWTIKLVFSSFICESIIRHRNMSFLQFEMLKDFSLPALSHFGSRFKLSSFFPPCGIVTPPPSCCGKLTSHKVVSSYKESLKCLQKERTSWGDGRGCYKVLVAVVTKFWSRLLQSSGRGFMTFFGSWVEYVYV